MSATLTILVVVDGLRPSDIDGDSMPFLSRIEGEGSSYTNALAAFPTLTRANAATLATGVLPGRTGIFGNRVWAGGSGPLDTAVVDDVRTLRNNGAMPQLTVAERAAAAGKVAVVVGNGSAGCTYLLNPGSDHGLGISIASVSPDGEVYRSLPDSARSAFDTLGAPPASEDEALEWAGDAAHTAISALAPDLLVLWCGQPDTASHDHGPASEASRDAIRRVDRVIEQLHQGAIAAGRECDLLVTSDHGFCHASDSLEAGPLMQDLADRTGIPEGHLVLTFNSGSIFGYFRNSVPLTDRKELVRKIAAQDWTGAVFSADAHCPANAFPLSLVVENDSPFSPDVVITARTSTPHDDEQSVSGSALHFREEGADPYLGVHGSVHPDDMRIPLVLHGPGIRSAVQHALPAGPADVAATLHLLVMGTGLPGTDGRILAESLLDGGDPIRDEATASTVERNHILLKRLRYDGRTYLLGATAATANR